MSGVQAEKFLFFFRGDWHPWLSTVSISVCPLALFTVRPMALIDSGSPFPVAFC
jgi:hypothetical protein